MLQVMPVVEESIIVALVEPVPVLICVLIVVCCTGQAIITPSSPYGCKNVNIKSNTSCFAYL